MDIFSLTDYRAVLKESLLSRKEHFPKAYTFQKMAEACRVQKTYLSTVLSGSGHLNADQVYLASEFLEFTPLQTEYTALLLEYERSVVPKRKRELLAQISDCRRRADKSEAHLDSEVVRSDDGIGAYGEYYLDPLFLLAHMYLTIDTFASDVSLLARKLGISQNALSRMLGVLSRLGIIELHEGGYRVLKEVIHLPEDSFIFPIHRKLIRMKTLERLNQKDEQPDSAYTFSATFSGDEATRTKLHAGFLKYLKLVQQLVKKAPGREVYQLNFDLFPW